MLYSRFFLKVAKMPDSPVFPMAAQPPGPKLIF
jgi:hypothetical protein